MEQDEDQRKGRTVTKPIDLRSKKSGVQDGVEKGRCVDLKESRSGNVSALTAARVRKSAVKPDIAEQIGVRLRGIYNDVLMQPIPDRFIDLLHQLASADARQRSRHAASKKGAK